MLDNPLSCSGLFICTAVLCLNSKFLKYSFFNITKCTPSSLNLQTNLQLIPSNNNYSQTEQKYLTNGFICSHCTRKNFIEYNLNTVHRCYEQTTKIKLRYYCPNSFYYTNEKNICQCSLSNQLIQPIKSSIRILSKYDKNYINTNRIMNINKSASKFVYFLVGSVTLLVLLGGIIGMIVYFIKLKSIQHRTLK